MKQLILALALVLAPAMATAGTLFPGYVETGGYGRTTAEFSQLGDDDMGFFLGAGGGVILGRQFMVGADLSLLANDIEYTTIGGEARFIEYTKAHLSFAWSPWGDMLVHPAVSVSAGMGWLTLRNPDKAPNEEDPDADTTFEGVPAVHVILNLTRSTRVTVSGGYRWVTGVNTAGFIDKDAEGAFATVGFVFGAF